MAQTPEKFVQDDKGGDDARPETVQRRIGQQYESLEHQRGGVDEDTARVDMHPDHAVASMARRVNTRPRPRKDA